MPEDASKCISLATTCEQNLVSPPIDSLVSHASETTDSELGATLRASKSDRCSYRHLPLPPRAIRLLRLMPHDDENPELRCQILEYPLGRSADTTHLYEALSYVWGEPGSSHYISINGYRLRITPNLHAALRSLRNQFVERVLWIDAICINQEDTAEKGQQIAYMAEIYSKASRVIVWLGEGQGGSGKDLEKACLAAGEMTKSSSIRPQAKELFLKVLDNPWFERIWVLQEVAAARHIIIKWGPKEVDGYAFCMALSSPELGLLAEASASVQKTASSVTFLMRGAAFRPKRVPIPSTGNLSLSMRPLGELINLYHTRRATILHDKIFALLGMSSDDPISAGLVPDYTLPWKILFEKLIRFLLGQRISVRTWNDAEMAVVKGRGHIIGMIRDRYDQSRTYGGRKYQVDYVEDEDQAGWGYLSPLDEWNPSHSIKSVQAGDIICLMEEAFTPMILRPCGDFFSIIVIMASNLKVNFRESALCDLLLVWDWNDITRDSEDRLLYETLMKDRGSEFVETGPSCPSDSAKRALSMALALEEAKQSIPAEERLAEFVESYAKQFGDNDPDLQACERKLEELRVFNFDYSD